MFKHLVVAVDASQCAQRALDLAFSIAKADSAGVTICTVVDAATTQWTDPSAGSAEHALSQARDAAVRSMNEARAAAESQGLATESALMDGDPAQCIVECARFANADGIVMGTHGWSGLRRLVVGSVAESVLRTAPCPVIVVRDGARA